MNLLKATGTIGGLTLVSRVLGFARDMIGSRILGASHANDAFNVAFTLPNIFRRLFGEGAFASGFVPLFSRRLAAGGHEDAQRFSNEILAVFMPTLLIVTALFEIAMPAFLWLIVSDYAATPGKFELAVELTRYTFPYLVFISLVALLSGVLNSLTRFAVAAFAPALLNMALIAALLIAPEGGAPTVRAMAVAVLAGGVLQFALCWVAVQPRRHQAPFRAAAPHPGGQGADRADRAGDAGGGRLPDQPALLHLLLLAARRGRAHQPCLCRPPQPAAAVDHRHRLGHRHPAGDQPRDRARRGARGGEHPGPRLRPLHAAHLAGDAGAGGGVGPDHRRLVPGRTLYRRGRRDHRHRPRHPGHRPSRLCAGQGADSGLLRPQGREDAGQDRGRRAGGQRRRQFPADPGDRHLQPGRGHLGRCLDQHGLALFHPRRARPFHPAALAGRAARPAIARRGGDGGGALAAARPARRLFRRARRGAASLRWALWFRWAASSISGSAG